MEIDQIQKLIAADQTRRNRIVMQSSYLRGENISILGRPAKEEPDTRIPIPIARKAVTLVSGYMCKPGNIIYTSEPPAYASDILQPILDANDEQLSTAETFKTTCGHGEAWEYHYVIDGYPRFVEIPVEQCIPIWSNELPYRSKLKGMIRAYCELEEDGKEKHEIYFWDDKTVRKWESYDGNNFTEVVSGDDRLGEHGYGEVPWCQAKINRDGSNLFDHVRQLIDFRDRLVSEDYANEAQRFANSYLLLRDNLSTELDAMGMSEVDKLRITRTFEGLGDNVNNAVSFLTKNIPIDFIKTVDETFERLIYDMMMVFNNLDVAATGQISGISLAYKLLPFEYACVTYEAYFSRFLQWRIRLIQNITETLSVNSQSRPQVTIKFRRDLPFDMQSAVDQYIKLKGLIPDRIALQLFPADFVQNIDDVVKEMEEAYAVPSMDTQTTEPIDTEDEAVQ